MQDVWPLVSLKKLSHRSLDFLNLNPAPTILFAWPCRKLFSAPNSVWNVYQEKKKKREPQHSLKAPPQPVPRFPQGRGFVPRCSTQLTQSLSPLEDSPGVRRDGYGRNRCEGIWPRGDFNCSSGCSSPEPGSSDQDLMLSLLSLGSCWSCWSHWPRWCPWPRCKCPTLALTSSSEPLSMWRLYPPQC